VVPSAGRALDFSPGREGNRLHRVRVGEMLGGVTAQCGEDAMVPSDTDGDYGSQYRVLVSCAGHERVRPGADLDFTRRGYPSNISI
jgi:hypothetical protein